MPDGKLTLTKLVYPEWNHETELFQGFSATILQIPGQKYTIGSSYEGRREKEEFIFFEYSFEKGQDFQINVDENGSFWIRRESKQYGLSVNGIPLKGGRKAYKLKFGDVIEIPFTNFPVVMLKKGLFQRLFTRSEKVKCPQAAILTFKQREFRRQPEENFKTIPLPKTDEETDKKIDPAFLIGSNELIVQTILSKLSFHFLPKLRLVSRLWNNIATPLVRRNCPTFLCSPKYRSMITHLNGKFNSAEQYENIYDGDDGSIFFRYEKEMEDLSPEKLHFSIPSFECRPPKYGQAKGNRCNTVEKRWEKYEDDFHHFLPFLRGRVRHLAIREIPIQFFGKYHILNELFKDLSPGLESLQLEDQIMTNLEKEFTQDWDFHQVKVLQVSYHFTLLDEDWVETEKCVENIVEKLGPNLETYEGNGGCFFRRICSKGFPNLSSVSLVKAGKFELKLLKDLTPLQNLSLYLVGFGDPLFLFSNVNPTSFSDVLKRHSQTLKKLVLYVRSDFVIRFPGFQMLEELTFVCENRVRLEGPVFYNVNFPALKSLFLDWTERFPVIEYLRGDDDLFRKYRLDSQSKVLRIWNENSQVFDSFFATNSGQVCETLKHLTIYHLDPEIEVNYVEEDVFQRVREMRKMFPNCDMDWLRSSWL